MNGGHETRQYCANNHKKQNFLDHYYLIICVNDSMTLELKKTYVLIIDLQYIYKHRHIFNNTQCKFITDIYVSVHSMQNTVASVITVSTSMDVGKKHIYCISVQFKINKK